MNICIATYIGSYITKPLISNAHNSIVGYGKSNQASNSVEDLKLVIAFVIKIALHFK